MTIYNDTATKDGILQECEVKLFGDSGYGTITNNTDLLYQFASRTNRALDRFALLAMTADGRWQWDDLNYTDLSIASTDIVSGQRDYSFALEHLEIEKVLINVNGVWTLLPSFDQDDADAKTYLEGNGPSGVPTKYDKRGNSLFFDIIPNFNSEDGLKIYFKRGPSYFLYNSTTKSAGIPSIFYSFISLHASAGYAVDRTMPQAVNLSAQVQQMERSIKEFYSKRNKDERQAITIYQENNK